MIYSQLQDIKDIKAKDKNIKQSKMIIFAFSSTLLRIDYIIKYVIRLFFF